MEDCGPTNTQTAVKIFSRFDLNKCVTLPEVRVELIKKIVIKNNL